MYVDHLAPLSALLKIPLITTSRSISSHIAKNYPGCNIQYIAPNECATFVISHYDQIVSCHTSNILELELGIAEIAHQKILHKIWLPHGNSDKGKDGSLKSALSEEKEVWVYGTQMHSICKTEIVVEVGNFRDTYFKQNREFYQNKFSFLKDKKVFLYAPTWDDHEGASSFHVSLAKLISYKPKDVILLIKPHFNLLKHPFKKTEGKGIIWIENETTIYPLLNSVHHLITDRSSIAYDFLTYDRPISFLLPDLGLASAIHKVGHQYLFEDANKVYAEKRDLFSEKRQQLYLKTFNSKADLHAQLSV